MSDYVSVRFHGADGVAEDRPVAVPPAWTLGDHLGDHLRRATAIGWARRVRARGLAPVAGEDVARFLDRAAFDLIPR